ncbi:MAG: iron complex outerrane recepter protein [Gammaproteobacteria bacterium]|jgi:outer membrane receptor protein involved in Fe transport|nr:iron complex outerrane recepter protein [Gammaproteobacteria bacterium]
MSNTNGRWTGRAAACAAALISIPVLAQESAEERGGPIRLEEVVVTATKRSESLQDVPVAVTALTSADIEARGFTNYSDFVNTVPNMYMQDLGPGQTQIYIRGLVAQGGSGFPVATYFGEAVTSVFTNNGGFANLRLVDIDRVEVLRGPQGTLFGANSLAGVLRVVPNAPNLTDLQVDAAASGWSTAHSGDGSEHFEGVLNLPIIKGELAARLVAYQDHIAGYLDNVVPAAAPNDYSAGFGAPDGTLVIPGHAAFTRKDINTQDTWGARGSVSWKPTDSLHIDWSYVAQEVRLNSEAGVQPAFGEFVVQRPLDLYSRGEDLEEERIGQVVVGYDWSAVSLTSATGYTRLERFGNQDISFLAAAAGLGEQLWPLLDRSKGESITEELRVQSRGDGPFQWLAGYFYTNTSLDLGQYVPDYSCPACLPEVLFGQPFAIRTIGSTIGEKQKQQSVFAEASYNITSQWTVGAGGRYLKDYIESFSPAAEGLLVGGTEAASAPVGGRNSIFNPSAYVRFKANEDMTYYAQAARGFRSGTPNQALAYDPNGPCGDTAAADGVHALTDPDTLWTYELGMKSTWADKRIAANIALFHQRWKGVQLAATQPCGFNGTVNGGDASGHGAELEMTAQLTKSLSANLTASYVYNKFDSATPNVGYSPGDRVPGAPEENASAGLQYNFALNNTWSGYARADYSYVGDVHFVFGTGAAATPYLQGGFGQANLRLQLQHQQFGFELFARNLTNKRAQEATGDPTQGGYAYMLRPRELGVEVRYSFDKPL